MLRCQQLLDLVLAISVFVIHIRTIQVVLVPWLSKSSLGYALLSLFSTPDSGTRQGETKP